MENFNVFVHSEPYIDMRVRIVIRPGHLLKLEPNKWRLLWAKKEWLLTDQQVHLLSVGGTVATEFGRISISMRANLGGLLTKVAEELVLSKAS